MEHRYRYYKYKKVPKYFKGSVISPHLVELISNSNWSQPSSQKIENQ
jgi:hypothetical protein